jgi:hypothetical protein
MRLVMHDLMHTLIRNIKLPRKLSLRDTCGMSFTDQVIALF